MKSNPIAPLFRTVLLSVLLSLAAGCASSGVGDAPYGYLITSFRGNGEDGLHLALSRDGRHWTPVAADRPLLTPQIGAKKLMRDPSIARGPDGIYHMVWTTGWWDRTIGHASSRDLIHWSRQQLIPLMEHEPQARNCWAPELFYDRAAGEWLILWSTTIVGRYPGQDLHEHRGEGDVRNHRVYVTRTRNFKSFTPAELFFDPGYNVIDAALLERGGELLMFFKDERRWPVKQTVIRLARSASLAGPWRIEPDALSGPGSEGPSAIEIDGELIVYFDRYEKPQHYAATATRDLRSWYNLTPSLQFPPGMRHGTVLALDRAAWERLASLE